MTPLVKLCLVLVAMAAASRGCSPPDGGYVAPTEAEKVHYSGHVLVGTVIDLITPDPFYKDSYKNETYGATVLVRCTYKGGILGDTITIHGAGIVPGHCTSKELEKDQQYLLFVGPQDETTGSYGQTYPAVKFTESGMEKYKVICGLQMRYPQENGITLPRKICPQPYKSSNCQRYVEGVNKTKKPPVETVEVRIEENTTNSTSTNDDNSSAATAVSLTLIALCSILGRLM